MQSTTKASGIEDLLTSMTGVHRPTAVNSGKCVTCKRDAKSFRDEISRREYAITGMCQACQDEVEAYYNATETY